MSNDRRDTVEYYIPEGLLAVANSAIVPPVGGLISIKKKTYIVTRVTYALDYVDESLRQTMRANVDLELVK